ISAGDRNEKSCSITITSWAAGIHRVEDDQRSSHQLLFLEPRVRVHPKGARIGERKIVFGRTARRNQRPRDLGHSVLLVWGLETMPMDEGRLTGLVFEMYAEC